MNLTDKQQRLVKKIYEDTKGEETFHEFIKLVCGKNIDELVNNDITTIIKYSTRKKCPTEKQKDMLRNLCMYLNIEVPTILTMKDFEETLEIFRQKYDVFLPYYINTSTVTYTIHNKAEKYFVGTQHRNTSQQDMKVIVFKDIVMLDYDNVSLEAILRIITSFPYTFSVYRTTRGYHVYVMSTSFNLQDIATHQLMYKMGCDKWYISFTKCYGTVVRLEPKAGRQETFVETFVRQVNNYHVIPEIKTLMEIKDEFIRNNNAKIM
jgi:hypothetical protein